MRWPTLMRGLAVATLAAAPALAQDATPAPHSLAAPATSFSPAQRADIVAIVRDALRTDPSILRDAVTALQADETRQQAGATRDALATNRQALVATPGDPTAGDAKGRPTVVEFYDTRCPYCRRMVPVMAELVRTTPGLRVVYKDIPILGPGSTLQAKALLSALALGGDAAYLRMQDAVMKDTATPSEATIRADATAAGLDPDRIAAGMGSPAVQARIDANLKLAGALHVEGTPALVIGNEMIPGAVSLDDLKSAAERTAE
ncbi:MAG: DsbA family protein [Janthinobacterium lividum]